ncbi:MAG: MotA/TolQ/ExbB proton channel family protein [Deltaproteobacteria bacterium]|nr:MotA/TolQ/ExbB proton channel family protein [Deltaproteobacteria bacterium]
MNKFIPFIISIVITFIWYLFVIFVLPYERFVQLFWERGIINVAITYVGVLGITLVIINLKMNQKKIKKELPTIFKRKINFKFLQLLNIYKNNITSKINEDYNYLAFFSALSISLGFLGTVIGLAGGISNLSVVFSKTNDLIHIKDNIFKLIANLGVAFDSTLLGLCFSITISLLISFSKKFELKRIEKIFDKVIYNSLLNQEITFESESTLLNLPEIDNKELKIYIENMNKLGKELSTLVTSHKELVSQFSEYIDFSSIQSFFNKIISILKYIALSFDKMQKRKTYKIIEETKE